MSGDFEHSESSAHESSVNGSFYLRFGKRALDLVFAGLGLLALTPVFLLVGLLVRLTSSGPAFFRQKRTGRYGHAFYIWKFRTMYQDPRGQGPLLTATDDARITPVGRWLRKTKCDELPQLLNVLKGEMSLVGPRPEVPRYTNQYNPRQRGVLSVRPGITGPTANLYISEEDLLASRPDKEAFYLSVLLPAKLESDLAYCRAIAFNRDLKLIANTITNLLLKSPLHRKTIPGCTRNET